MKEIGSEFDWQPTENNPEDLDWFPACDDWSLTFSGRTAFETVIADIGDIKKVCFPSYLCDSMIEPFRNVGAAIEFYSVDYGDEFNALLTVPEDCDVLVLCNYFGYHIKYPMNEINKFKNRGGIIIEDITHSLLSEQQYHSYSNYLVASVRKWGPIPCGGLCCKCVGKIKTKPLRLADKGFLELKTAAMQLKHKYINNLATIDKTEFLEMYAESNHFFETDYSNVKIDKKSEELLRCWDVNEMRLTRRKNAALLHNELRNNNNCKLVFDIKDIDCPLFVPIVVFGGNRNLLKQKLIKNNIYCPSHWPRPKASCDSNMYDSELSLICDQRYTEKDMMRIVDVIKNFRG